MKADFSERTWPAILLLLLVGFLAYANTFQVPFILDDKQSIVANEYLGSLDGFYGGSPTRTLGYLTFALNYHFGGLEVSGYHVVNLLIHLSTALLVYWLARLTFRTPYLRGSRLAPRAGLVALLATLLLVAHPVQTQAVTYIVQRLTSLATMFYLLSVVLYVQARLTRESGVRWRRSGAEKYPADVEGPAASGKRQAGSGPGWKVRQGYPGFRTLNPVPVFLLAGSVLAAVLAMKTKEISFTLPLAILLYELFFFQGAWKRRLLYLLPVLSTLPIIPLSIFTIIQSSDESAGDLLSDVSEQTRAHTSMSRLDYLFTQFRVIVTYLRLLVLPINQNLDYDYPVHTSFFTPPVFFSFLLLAALAGLAVHLYLKSRRLAAAGHHFASQPLSSDPEFSAPGLNPSHLQPPAPNLLHSSPAADPAIRLVSFGIFWFFLTLSVESSLVPILDVIFEHRLYLPSVGAATAFAGVFFLVAEKFAGPAGFRFAVAIAGLLVLSLSVATYQRNQVWGEDIRLWTDVVNKSPQKGRPHNELGVALEDADRRPEAMKSFHRAIEVDPYHFMSHYNLGELYLVSGQPETALPFLREAFRLKPDLEMAYVKYGAALLRSRQFREAAVFLERNLDRIGENGEARFYLGAAYAFQGNQEAARKELEVVSRLDPSLAADLAGLLGMGARMTHGR